MGTGRKISVKISRFVRAVFFQRSIVSSALGSATMPESPLPVESELVDEETIHLVKRLIAVVRTRRSPKAVETYEQVKFLVDYIQFLQARASNPLSTMSLPLSTDLFADWDVSMD